MSVLIDEVSKDSRRSVAAAKDLQGNVTFGLAVALGISCLLTILFARRLSRFVLAPVEAMRMSTERFAAGELSSRIDLTRHDELGMLATAFNDMADAIESSHESLTHQAGHDSLTGLANRSSFLASLDKVLTEQREDSTVSVLFVDLDDFKTVNDVEGHAAGDQLLQFVAERLRSSCRDGDLVARLGGDEFAALVRHGAGAAPAIEMAKRIMAALETPFSINGKQTRVTVSIGVATVDGNVDDAEEAVRQADIAMYMAKGMGKSCFQVFDVELHDEMLDRLALKAELRGAVERGEFVVEYQPIFDLRYLRLVGVEALVRWNHPSRGLLSPAAFIPVAEDGGEIAALDQFVLGVASRQVRTWQWERPAHRDLWLSVNVSGAHVDTGTLVADVERALAESGLPPTSLVLELTETALMQRIGDEARRSFATLRDRGVRIAIDDFGTGFSSLSYLQRLPVDVLKVDRSFVSGDDALDQVPLLQTIVALGENLGLSVVAEGIEESDQQARLNTLGCHLGQGYLLARPTSPTGIATLLDHAAVAVGARDSA